MPTRPPVSIPALEALVERALGRPQVLARLALSLLKAGAAERARAAVAQAVALAPRDMEVREVAAEIMSSEVPKWHFVIVQDEGRNAAYDAALRRAIRPGMRILDIGTGTGLLALMAARAGADVVTCEMNPPVADLAHEIVERNGLSARVHLIPKHSGALDRDVDLGGGADLLVSEIVSANMLGQGVLAVMEDASRRLLRPGAHMIPARGFVRVALAEDTKRSPQWIETVDGFDLSPFNRLASPTYHVRAGDGRLLLRSDPQDLFAFDFESGGPFPSSRSSVNLTSTGGRANCIAQWIGLDLDEEGRYENAPGTSKTSCWPIIIHPLQQALDLPIGMPISIGGSHDRMALRIWLERPRG